MWKNDYNACLFWGWIWKMVRLLTLFFVVLSPLFAVDFGDATRGKALSSTCVVCHGVDGNSPSDAFPKIAGQHVGYTFKQLKDFKSKKRNNAIMSGFVAALSEQDMKDLASYFAQQTSAPNVAKKDKDKDLIALGKRLYRGGHIKLGIPACAACHSPKGRGIAGAKFPKISAQHPAYTIAQLKAFRQAILNEQLSDNPQPARENDAQKMMRQISGKLTDKQINALAHYIATLH